MRRPTARWASASSESVPPSPAVVGPEHQHDVLERHDQDQRPEHERDDPDHLALTEDAVPRRPVQRLAEGV